jgi:hypothetical protein
MIIVSTAKLKIFSPIIEGLAIPVKYFNQIDYYPVKKAHGI